MNKCVECGKKLGFFEGYYHPILGKKNLVCGLCFVKLDDSITKWSEFVRLNSFNPESNESASRINWRLLYNRIVGVHCSKFFKNKKLVH